MSDETTPVEAATAAPAPPAEPTPAPAVNGATRPPAHAAAEEPAVAVTMNLDDLEREGGTPASFTFRHLDRDYTMIERDEIDWQDLLVSMRNPVMFIRSAMSPEDHEAFLDSKCPMWKMNALIERYMKHFGLPGPGEASGSSGF